MENKETKTEMLDNLRFYEAACQPPKDALKPIGAGRLKGKSDINPMWRMKKLTEIFGPVGFGWRYEIDKQWTEVYGEEVKCFCNITLYVRDPETKEWSLGIPGIGGSSIVSKEKGGPYVDDDGYKKALTDALSIAMKALGVAANVWYGAKAEGDIDSKYNNVYQQPQQSQQPQLTAEQSLKMAIAEMKAVTTESARLNVWSKWVNLCPSLAEEGGAFCKCAYDKYNELNK